MNWFAACILVAALGLNPSAGLLTERFYRRYEVKTTLVHFAQPDNSGRLQRNLEYMENNFGFIEFNDDTISTNYGTIGKNYGTVESNLGVVAGNYGVVKKNAGVIIEAGQPSAWSKGSASSNVSASSKTDRSQTATEQTQKVIVTENFQMLDQLKGKKPFTRPPVDANNRNESPAHRDRPTSTPTSIFSLASPYPLSGVWHGKTGKVTKHPHQDHIDFMRKEGYTYSRETMSFKPKQSRSKEEKSTPS